MAKFLRPCMVTIGLLALLCLPIAKVEAGVTSCSPWSIIKSPSQGVLNGVAAVSASDIWAVGSLYPSTLTEHWDGTKWNVVTSPNISGYQNYLHAVASVITNNVWAVGFAYNDPQGILTLIEHWDGSKWSIATSPKSTQVDLTSIAVVSASDIWVVGNDNSGSAISEHWDGAKWSIVPTAQLKYGANLNGVTALSTNNVWAVGYYTDNNNVDHPLIEHWNGTGWGVVQSPTTQPQTNTHLVGVAASSANDVWAVGYYEANYQSTTLVEHWDGKQWSIISSPNIQQENTLAGVVVVSANDVRAVGYTQTTFNVGTYQTLVEQWNGSSWSVVASPSTPATNYQFFGATLVPGTSTVWAVGDYFSNLPYKTLTVLYC